MREAERANVILEEQLRQRDIELMRWRERGKNRILDDDVLLATAKETPSHVQAALEPVQCATCTKLQAQYSKSRREQEELKVECTNLQQKIDKMKNVIQLYRQEKRQMEDYIEKEKRTAKSLVIYPPLLV